MSKYLQPAAYYVVVSFIVAQQVSASMPRFGVSVKDMLFSTPIKGYFVDEYNRINKLLVEKTNSNNPEENMNLIEESFNTDSEESRQLADAEILLYSLKEFGNGEDCNERGFEIIGRNLRALGKSNLRDIDQSKMSRLESIFVAYLKQHEAACRDKYPAIAEEIISEMDKAKLELVSQAADNYIEYKFLSKLKSKNEQSEAQKLFQVAKQSPYEMDYKYMYKILNDLAKDDPNAKHVNIEEVNFLGLYSYKRGLIDVNSLKSLFKKYLEEPCEYFMKKLMRKVFGSASFWQDFHQVDESNVEFYRNWSRFKFCMSSHRDKERTFEKMVDYARSLPELQKKSTK